MDHEKSLFTRWKGKLTKSLQIYKSFNPVDIYLLKTNNRNTRTRCEICSKLKIKTPEQGQ